MEENLPYLEFKTKGDVGKRSIPHKGFEIIFWER
jgi:hypothetical protein